MSMTSTIRLLELFNWLERRRQCRALGDRVDDRHLLADIGLTREQALREAGKLFRR